jgi:hypothetical protein
VQGNLGTRYVGICVRDEIVVWYGHGENGWRMECGRLVLCRLAAQHVVKHEMGWIVGAYNTGAQSTFGG